MNTHDQDLRDRFAQLADRSLQSNLSTNDVQERSNAKRRHRRVMASTSAVALAIVGVVGVVGIVTNGQQPTAKTGAAAPETTTSTNVADTTTSIDPTGPVAVTGIRIGESDASNPPLPGYRPDGTIDLAQVPEWIAVGNPANPEGGCVGYVRKGDMWPQAATPENLSAPIVIYDENEQPIGQIANGKTTIFDS